MFALGYSLGYRAKVKIKQHLFLNLIHTVMENNFVFFGKTSSCEKVKAPKERLINGEEVNLFFSDEEKTVGLHQCAIK